MGIITPEKWSFNDFSIMEKGKIKLHLWDYHKWCTLDVKPENIFSRSTFLVSAMTKDQRKIHKCLIFNYHLEEAEDSTIEYMSNSPFVLKTIKNKYDNDVEKYMDNSRGRFHCQYSHCRIDLEDKQYIALKKS